MDSDRRRYRIRVRSSFRKHLDEIVAPLAVHDDGPGIKILEGELPDQSALHGVLRVLQRYSVDLVSILSEPVAEKTNDPAV